MKYILYACVAAAALAALLMCRDCPTTTRVLAAEAGPVSTITGDLVIDFLGSVRGYVEPCG